MGYDLVVGQAHVNLKDLLNSPISITNIEENIGIELQKTYDV